MGGRVHHSAVWVRDVEASLRFYRDGIGLEVLMDQEFDGDWPTLFRAGTTHLRSVFLGDTAHPDAGVVELVAFAGAVRSGGAPAAPAPAVRAPGPGFFLLSFFVDVDSALARLAGLGFADVRRIEHPGPRAPVVMATVRDPDGVLIELVGITTA